MAIFKIILIGACGLGLGCDMGATQQSSLTASQAASEVLVGVISTVGDATTQPAPPQNLFHPKYEWALTWCDDVIDEPSTPEYHFRTPYPRVGGNKGKTIYNYGKPLLLRVDGVENEYRIWLYKDRERTPVVSAPPRRWPMMEADADKLLLEEDCYVIAGKVLPADVNVTRTVVRHRDWLLRVEHDGGVTKGDLTVAVEAARLIIPAAERGR